MSKKNYVFYAVITEGYVFKTLIDVLSLVIQRTSFQINKKGIYNRDQDEKNRILFDVAFLREDLGFQKYRCHKSLNFSINLKHSQKMLKNVKKKDVLTLSIGKEDGKPDDKLVIKVTPIAGGDRSETVAITISHNDDIKKRPMSLPEYSYDEEENEIKVYRFPMMVPSTDFQRFKKMTSVGKDVAVKMQGNNYISFYSDCGNLYSSEHEFGRILDPEDMESSDSEDPRQDEKTPKDISWYLKTFDMKLFSALFKLPGLCSQMGFFAPKVEGFPLKINVMAGKLGPIQVYIKDKKQIEHEEKLRKKEEEEISGIVK